jgi:hypothetical protein
MPPKATGPRADGSEVTPCASFDDARPFARTLIAGLLPQGTRNDDVGIRQAGQAVKRPSQCVSVPPPKPAGRNLARDPANFAG